MGARRKAKKATADDDEDDKCTGNTNDNIQAVAKIVRNEKNRAMSKADQRKAAKAAKKGK